MAASWPATVPLFAMQSNYQESPEDNVAEFAPEVGPPKRRRRSSISADIINCSTVMTFDEYDTLLAFWRGDLQDGVLPFTRKHPRRLSSPDVSFFMTTKPTLRAIGPDLGEVAMSFRSKP